MMKKAIIIILLIVLLFMPKTVFAATSYRKGVVNNYGVNIRSGPGTWYSVVRTIYGSSINLSSPESVDVIGEDSGWYKIQFLYSGNTYTGYIRSDFLDVKSVTTNDDYRNSLVQKDSLIVMQINLLKYMQFIQIGNLNHQ